MAQFESPQSPQSQFAPSQPKQLPLAVVMAIDLFLIIFAVFAVQIIIVLIVVLIKVFPMMGNPDQVQALLEQFGSGMNETAAVAFLGVGGIFATLLTQNLIFVLIPYLRLRWRKEPLREFGFQMSDEPLKQFFMSRGVSEDQINRWFKFSPLTNLILFGIGLSAITLICNILIGLIFLSLDMQQNQTAQYPIFQGDYLGQFIFLIGAGLLAPIGEEVLFRGYIFNGIRRSLLNKPWAIWVSCFASALPFSLVHMFSASENVIALLVPALAIGVLFAIGMHISKSIIPCIVAHAMNNSIALLIFIFGVNNPQFLN